MHARTRSVHRLMVSFAGAEPRRCGDDVVELCPVRETDLSPVISDKLAAARGGQFDCARALLRKDGQRVEELRVPVGAHLLVRAREAMLGALTDEPLDAPGGRIALDVVRGLHACEGLDGDVCGGPTMVLCNVEKCMKRRTADFQMGK